MFTLFSKLAEPPPPKGMSVDEWDKYLADNPPKETTVGKVSAPVDLIRKTAGRQAFERLTASPVSSMPALELKLAAVDDQELLKIAWGISNDAESALETYEAMGGTFEKSAFGAPMFQANQMAGSPALQSGMGARAVAPAPLPKQPAPVAPTPQAGQGGQGGGVPMATTTTTKQVVAPAAPSAPSAPSSGQGSA
jgi:hypothetical protein